MHRKRVTCELHDSYFRLMIIKYAIPRTAEHIPMASYGEILSGRLNYYITRWRQEISQFGDPLVTRYGRESQHPAEWAPGPPVEQPWRTRTTHGYVQRGWGGQYVAVFVQSPTPSHTQTLQIKWKLYFLKKSSRVFIASLSLCRCVLHESAYVYTTHVSWGVSHRSLFDSKFLQVFRILLSVLAYISNDMIGVVSILPLTSNSSIFFFHQAFGNC